MITLTLLHPVKGIPVQNWTFDQQSSIRIGRSTQNDVVLYSAVVSRHHLEIRSNGPGWDVVNLGANGTYVDGNRIAKMVAQDGMIVRLASSGPQIQLWLKHSQTEDGRPSSELVTSEPRTGAKVSSAEKLITRETVVYSEEETHEARDHRS
ncbi:MAG: FHA domain-containing protein [Cyanobacteria bacterium P01_H01_bin.15]